RRCSRSPSLLAVAVAVAVVFASVMPSRTAPPCQPRVGAPASAPRAHLWRRRPPEVGAAPLPRSATASDAAVAKAAPLGAKAGAPTRGWQGGAHVGSANAVSGVRLLPGRTGDHAAGARGQHPGRGAQGPGNAGGEEHLPEPLRGPSAQGRADA